MQDTKVPELYSMSNMLLNILLAIVLKLKTAATLNYYTFLHTTHFYIVTYFILAIVQCHNHLAL